MADLTELRTAVRDTVEGAAAPGFADLVGRARGRRRRRTIGLATTTAVVLAGTAALLLPLGDTATGPSPAGTPSPSSTPSAPASTPTTAVERLRATTPEQIVASGELFSYGSAGSGSLLTVWRVCVQDHVRCRYAWRMPPSPGSGTLTGAVPGGDGPEVYPAGAGYVLQPRNHSGLLVRADGSVGPLELGDPPLPARSGDVVVATDGGPRIVDPRTAKTWTLVPPAGADGLGAATVTPDGTVWALPGFAGPGQVEITRLRAGSWSSYPVDDPTSDVEVPAMLATGGGHVAVLSSYDGATVWPVGLLAVSVDDGGTWDVLGKAGLPFATVDSMAATATGVLFVAEPDGTLWRSADGSWARFAKVAGLGPVGGLVPAGDGVLARIATASASPARLVLVGGDGGITPVPAR